MIKTKSLYNRKATSTIQAQPIRPLEIWALNNIKNSRSRQALSRQPKLKRPLWKNFYKKKSWKRACHNKEATNFPRKGANFNKDSPITIMESIEDSTRIKSNLSSKKWAEITRNISALIITIDLVRANLDKKWAIQKLGVNHRHQLHMNQIGKTTEDRSIGKTKQIKTITGREMNKGKDLKIFDSPREIRSQWKLRLSKTSKTGMLKSGSLSVKPIRRMLITTKNKWGNRSLRTQISI